MIAESLGYLRNSEDWIKTVLIGGLLALFSFLIVPLFVVFGYYVRVLRGTMHDDEQPPVFDEWGEMVVDGLKAFAIYLVYGLVPAIIGAIIGVVGIGGAIAGNSGASGFLGGIVALVGFVVALALGLLAAYIIPAAVANFVEKDDVMAGFAVGEIKDVITTGKYATAWGMAFVLLLAGGIVTSVLSVVPILGTAIGLFLTFYAAVAAFYIIGHAWGELHHLEMADEGESLDEQAAV